MGLQNPNNGGKDPAVLLYTKDFLTGTMFMTNEEVGVYIRALCYQHQKGHFDQSEFDGLMGGGDKFPNVRRMFITDKDGFYYNKRMEEEAEKRRKFCELQRIRATKKQTQDDDTELPH
jgi:uncharacterized protein YdaU (DUF1376 family)